MIEWSPILKCAYFQGLTNELRPSISWAPWNHPLKLALLLNYTQTVNMAEWSPRETFTIWITDRTASHLDSILFDSPRLHRLRESGWNSSICKWGGHWLQQLSPFQKKVSFTLKWILSLILKKAKNSPPVLAELFSFYCSLYPHGISISMFHGFMLMGIFVVMPSGTNRFYIKM